MWVFGNLCICWKHFLFVVRKTIQVRKHTLCITVSNICIDSRLRWRNVCGHNDLLRVRKMVTFWVKSVTCPIPEPQLVTGKYLTITRCSGENLFLTLLITGKSFRPYTYDQNTQWMNRTTDLVRVCVCLYTERRGGAVLFNDALSCEDCYNVYG